MGIARTIAGTAAIAASIVLTGCTVVASATPSASSSGAESASPSAAAPIELLPDGSAADNLPYFDEVNTAFFAANPDPDGRAIVDNLVAAGFDKATMQVTPDATTIGREADSVQFSVFIGGSCLIGQSSGAGYASTSGPPVTGQSCLSGITRAIDW